MNLQITRNRFNVFKLSIWEELKIGAVQLNDERILLIHPNGDKAFYSTLEEVMTVYRKFSPELRQN